MAIGLRRRFLLDQPVAVRSVRAAFGHDADKLLEALELRSQVLRWPTILAILATARLGSAASKQALDVPRYTVETWVLAVTLEPGCQSLDTNISGGA